jgi:hypothetical protein
MKSIHVTAFVHRFLLGAGPHPSWPWEKPTRPACPFDRRSLRIPVPR